MADVAGAVTVDQDVLTYERLMRGERVGTARLMVDHEMIDGWERLYGYRPVGGPLPLAFAPMLIMRAFLTIVAPRPPGNLHVGQSYQIRRMPPAHHPLLATVDCTAKELRKARRVVSFAVSLAESDDAPPLLCGTSTMFWAA